MIMKVKDKSINFERMDYQTSKYLGGDLKHTHMVKGLDYILLNRIRQKNMMIQEEKRKSNTHTLKERSIYYMKDYHKRNWNSTFARNILQLIRPELILTNLNTFNNESYIHS